VALYRLALAPSTCLACPAYRRRRRVHLAPLAYLGEPARPAHGACLPCPAFPAWAEKAWPTAGPCRAYRRDSCLNGPSRAWEQLAPGAPAKEDRSEITAHRITLSHGKMTQSHDMARKYLGAVFRYQDVPGARWRQPRCARQPMLKLLREKRAEILDRVGYVAGGAATGIRIGDDAPLRACVSQDGKPASTRCGRSPTSARCRHVAHCGACYWRRPERGFRPPSRRRQVRFMRQLRLRCQHGAVICVLGPCRSAAFRIHSFQPGPCA
jgi:hypothetical protein